MEQQISKPSPQARYNREARADPLTRALLAERQHTRRARPDYRRKNALYMRGYRARTSTRLTKDSPHE